MNDRDSCSRNRRYEGRNAEGNRSMFSRELFEKLKDRIEQKKSKLFYF